MIRHQAHRAPDEKPVLPSGPLPPDQRRRRNGPPVREPVLPPQRPLRDPPHPPHGFAPASWSRCRRIAAGWHQA